MSHQNDWFSAVHVVHVVHDGFGCVHVEQEMECVASEHEEQIKCTQNDLDVDKSPKGNRLGRHEDWDKDKSDRQQRQAQVSITRTTVLAANSIERTAIVVMV
jgi:hypothetical protein